MPLGTRDTPDSFPAGQRGRAHETDPVRPGVLSDDGVVPKLFRYPAVAIATAQPSGLIEYRRASRRVDGLHRLPGLVRQSAISTGNSDHRPVPAHLTNAVVGRQPTARVPADDGRRVAARQDTKLPTSHYFALTFK